MVFTLDTSLHEDLAPLAWLVGTWAGAGVVGYPTIESVRFGQEVVCSHDGRRFLRWDSRTWLLDDDGNQVRPLATETGFWRPVTGATDGTNCELLLAHPTGFVEMYAGVAEPAKVELRTPGAFDVVSVENIDTTTGTVDYIASPDNVTQRYLYRTKLSGAPHAQRLTPASLGPSPIAPIALVAITTSERARPRSFSAWPTKRSDCPRV